MQRDYYMTKRAEYINKIQQGIKLSWLWFSIMFIPIYSLIITKMTVIPREQTIALVSSILYLEFIYAIIFGSSLLLISLFSCVSDTKLKSKKLHNSKKFQIQVIVCLCISLLSIYITTKAEKNNVKQEASMYNISTRNMGFLSDGIFGSVAFSVRHLDTDIINIISAAFAPTTFGISLCAGGFYKAYRVSNDVYRQYSGILLLINDYKNDFGRPPYPNPWTNVFDKYRIKYYPIIVQN